MISVILGVGIPILYLAVFSALAINLCDRPVFRDHHGNQCVTVAYPILRRPCNCFGFRRVLPVLIAFFWPLTSIFLVVWVLMKGTKQPKGTRIGRAQRRVRKMQARIDELQRDLGMEP